MSEFPKGLALHFRADQSKKPPCTKQKLRRQCCIALGALKVNIWRPTRPAHSLLSFIHDYLQIVPCSSCHCHWPIMILDWLLCIASIFRNKVTSPWLHPWLKRYKRKQRYVNFSVTDSKDYPNRRTIFLALKTKRQVMKSFSLMPIVTRDNSWLLKWAFIESYWESIFCALKMFYVHRR